ncbi:MAG: pyridoxamine 5'-phosphate oxidase [Nonlabens sp.]|uniref:pyridoxamine 5'-phosphate oxidase n=1 Tax=Nonlabens sp. TaxID=1888209 RepID=UPI003EF9F2B0
MQRDLQNLRKNYVKGALVDDKVPMDPFQLFDQWFIEAKEHLSIDEANAMSLCTIGLDGYPKNRIVLLKEIEKGCFLFYTNYNSEKAIAMEKNPSVSLHFFWPALERQVIIKGDVSKVSREKSANYFKSRPRGSQLGAWASDQSSKVPSREFLEQKLLSFEQKFDNKEIPLPEHWGGYSVTPISFEFWQGRPNRLHDRYLFEIKADKWISKRLAP